MSLFHVNIHLGEGDLDTFHSKPLRDPAVDRVLCFIGKIVFPHPDLEDEVQA